MRSIPVRTEATGTRVVCGATGTAASVMFSFRTPFIFDSGTFSVSSSNKAFVLSALFLLGKTNLGGDRLTGCANGKIKEETDGDDDMTVAKGTVPGLVQLSKLW